MHSKIEAMIDRAAQEHDGGDAMKWAQAALNAANAMRAMDEVPRYTREGRADGK